MATSVDDKTKISLYAVAVCMPFLVGGILWLSSIDAKASGAQEDLKGVRSLLLEVREHVIRIEEHQKTMEEEKNGTK